MRRDPTTTTHDPWTEAMRRGNFEAAWAISDRILAQRRASGATCWHWPRHLQYIWTGAPLAGKRVLVRCYHGLGDTIQFIRFAAPLRQLAREVIVWVQPELLELIGAAPGVDKVLPLHDGAPDVDYDVDIEIMELPHALRMTAASMPRKVPYLFPPDAPAKPVERDVFAIGFVWQAGDWDTRRSIPISDLAPLTMISGARCYSLQRGAAAALGHSIGLIDIGSDAAVETARRLRGLDLIISVDTMLAHLAGALGHPVWTLLHAHCDWRWQHGYGSSAWYPTMRMFSQPSSGDWPGVIETVRVALVQLLAPPSGMSDHRL